MVRHWGFTLIELIITIIVLGIIFASLPMLLIQNQRASEEVLSQEAIYASVAKMSQILSYRWDEHSINDRDNLAVVYGKTLDSNGTVDLKRSNGSRYRVGHFKGSSRRSFFPTETNATALLGAPELTATLAETQADDIDDHIQNGASLISIDTEHGYKHNYTINTRVSYVPDSANYANNIVNFDFDTVASATGTSNIKRISLEVLLDNQRQFQLDTYVSNIGETDIASRVFP